MSQIVANFVDGALASHEFWEGDPSAVDSTAPEVTEATVNNDFITLDFSEAVTTGADSFSGFALTMSGGAVTLSYSFSDGSDRIVYSLSRDIHSSETGTLAFTKPTDGIQDEAGNKLESFSDFEITNNSVEPPSISGTDSHQLREGLAFSTTLTIENLNGITPTLKGNDAALFSLALDSGDSWDLTMTARDFDSPTDANSDNIYEVTVEVDAGEIVVDLDIAIEVLVDNPPVITLIGDPEISLVQGQEYTDDGATASDDWDGDLTASIVTVSTVDTNSAGSYSVTYNVSDTLGNAAEEVVRTVTVSAPDDTPAQFSLGSDKTDASPFEVVDRKFTIEGIDSDISVIVNAIGDAEVSNGNCFDSAVVGQLGDEITVRIIAPGFEETRTGGASISGVSDSFSVTTSSSSEFWVDQDHGDEETWT